ncbi:GNAT family N-acetyltransferase [Confluentibacter flavum]|uniref:GNAT family N-acetyltransferase n=1 Tax=Confluentibacter flavum TaxID=1909700 RepID=A0A2N3HLG1_9FLAO|nr:GNAT family N-acetyltransferase [Confluentibacter flavum]PKQ45795.1 GNAT family N-acetyltransferase [Confluentibacter flavum]
MLHIIIRPFNELSTHELYAILQLRSAVFVVEQDCVYQDLDGKDQIAMHVLGIKNNNIIAYTRVFKPGDYLEYASVGRVVVAKTERNNKYGYDIMNASISAIEKEFKETTIKISAQAYLKGFYNTIGFKQIGEEYLEDNIPHISMIKD